jgi:hypothetical protein
MGRRGQGTLPPYHPYPDHRPAHSAALRPWPGCQQPAAHRTDGRRRGRLRRQQAGGLQERRRDGQRPGCSPPIFPLHLRSPAMSLCTIANWAFNFLVSFTFLSLVDALTFFVMRVPETNGRSLEEIEQQLRRKRRVRAPAAGTTPVPGPKGATGA